MRLMAGLMRILPLGAALLVLPIVTLHAQTGKHGQGRLCWLIPKCLER
jgi:hypothetical protein